MVGCCLVMVGCFCLLCQLFFFCFFARSWLALAVDGCCRLSLGVLCCWLFWFVVVCLFVVARCCLMMFVVVDMLCLL